MSDYCESYTEWLLSDRKLMAPCSGCAQAHSLRKRAEAHEEHAKNMRLQASVKLTETHPLVSDS